MKTLTIPSRLFTGVYELTLLKFALLIHLIGTINHLNHNAIFTTILSNK